MCRLRSPSFIIKVRGREKGKTLKKEGVMPYDLEKLR